MRYLLLPHMDEAMWRALTDAEQLEWIAAFRTYGRDLRNEDALIGAYRPDSSSEARTVRVAEDGERIVEGPYADTRLQLSGVYVIDAADMHAALAWAKRNPAAQFGIVEVRPIQGPPGP